MAIPQLSAEQLQAVRESATRDRRARAALKEEMSSGSLSVAEALAKAQSDDALCRMKVIDFLRAIPRIGHKRADNLMHSLAIAETRRIRGLGRHQVERLLQHFGG